MLGLCSFISGACSIGRNVLVQQTRNTFILKRRTPPPLHKKGGRPSKMKGRHFVYDFVKDTNVEKKQDLSVILKEYVEGVGNPGDIITTRPMLAYKTLLMPGHAVYATPENMEKYKVDEDRPKQEVEYSSPYVKKTLNNLERLVLQITMSKTEPWILQPWHIKTSFRKTGFVVPEYAIEMPPVEIKGPDLSLQKKEFYVTVTINKREKVNVRCRIHHWAMGLDRLKWEENHWMKPLEPLIPEQAPVLAQMPLYKQIEVVEEMLE